MNKAAPSFINNKNDAGVWLRTLHKIEETRGVSFERWDSEEFKAAAAYYPRAYNAQDGFKYQTGERVAYIRPDGTPVVYGDPTTAAAAALSEQSVTFAKECPNCEQVFQFYQHDYVCVKCRNILEEA